MKPCLTVREVWMVGLKEGTDGWSVRSDPFQSRSINAGSQRGESVYFLSTATIFLRRKK